jgi:hypothetical protein
MADDPRPARLARIEAQIARHRADYLTATWALRGDDAQFHAREVDRLLDLWVRVQRGELTAAAREV